MINSNNWGYPDALQAANLVNISASFKSFESEKNQSVRTFLAINHAVEQTRQNLTRWFFTTRNPFMAVLLYLIVAVGGYDTLITNKIITRVVDDPSTHEGFPVDFRAVKDIYRRNLPLYIRAKLGREPSAAQISQTDVDDHYASSYSILVESISAQPKSRGEKRLDPLAKMEVHDADASIDKAAAVAYESSHKRIDEILHELLQPPERISSIPTEFQGAAGRERLQKITVEARFLPAPTPESVLPGYAEYLQRKQQRD